MLNRLKKYPLFLNNVKQTYPNIEPGVSCLSRTVIAGNIVFSSGFDGRNTETGQVTSNEFRIQLETCLDNIRFALAEADTPMNNLFKMTVLLKNMTNIQTMWKTMLEYYQKYAPDLVREPPAITIAGVIELAKPECLIEIDAMAVILKDEPGWEMKKNPMYIGEVQRTYPDIGSGQPFFSESVTVGNLLFISGMDGSDPQTGQIVTNVFEEQMRIALDKVRTAMDRAGSSMSNIIKTMHFLTGIESLLAESKFKWHTYSPASDRLWKSELEYYDRYAPALLDELPASTFLKIPSLPDTEALGQVEVTGVISKFRSGWKTKNYPCYLAKRGFPHHIGDIKKYYANSVVAGNLILLSGACPFDPVSGGFETAVFEEQMWIALDSLRAAMEETGSSLENLIKTNILLPNPDNLAVMRKIELEYYQKYAPSLVDEPPASSVIHLLNLATPKLLVELDAIGFLPSK